MASPISSAYNATEVKVSPYLGHAVPTLTYSGLDLPVHPDYALNFPLWKTIRDCYEGEPAIKGAAQTYLPKLAAHKDSDYDGYLRRGYFYNATRRTHTGLMGSIFRKPPEFTLPESARRLSLQSISIDGQPLDEFIRTVAHDMVLTGRYGLLVDLEPNAPSDAQPYIAGYAAESIYSWRQIKVKGRRVVDRVILRETEYVDTEYGRTKVDLVRVLRLDYDAKREDWVYSQEEIRASQDTSLPPQIKRIPITIRGKPLNYIPFVFMNTKDILPGCHAPTLIDIATLNLSHYQSTAHLEHGRFYAGMPTYVTMAGEGAGGSPFGDGETLSPLTVGPSNVWELEHGAKAQLLEFTGHGLTFLENATEAKQLQMQSLGGKLISATRNAAALSDEAWQLLETGDEATLLDIVRQMERGTKQALLYCLDFMGANLTDKDKADLRVELNKEFVRSELTAREIRALQMLYERGLIPLDVLYYSLREVSVIPQEYTLDEFKVLLENKKQLYVDPKIAENAQKHKDALELARIAAARTNNAPSAD